MNSKDLRIRASSHDDFSRFIRLLTWRRSEKKGTVEVLNVSSFDEQDMSVYADMDHSLLIEKEAAQILMDDLWNCGLRPTEGHGSAGAMSATQNHLRDLQGGIGYLQQLVATLVTRKE